MMKTIRHKIRTSSRDEMQNVTHLVEQALRQWGMREGFVNIFVPHTTAGVTINENADPDVVHDMLKALDVAAPHEQDFYRHNEGNSAAHVKSSMVGCSVIIPVSEGRMMLGVWQGIYFCEFDGPRSREMIISRGE